jgi:anti-anti-sigma regulatory factor
LPQPVRLSLSHEADETRLISALQGEVMLRITVCNSPSDLAFRLEGRLAGPWVHELRKCWQSALASRKERSLSIDLAEVTFVDDAGKDCLAAIHRQGVKFIGGDCLIRAIIEEIQFAAELDDEAKSWA